MVLNSSQDGLEIKTMVTPGRFERPTYSLGNCCSIHLSYGAISKRAASKQVSI